MTPELAALVERFRHYRMTEAELEAQIISFAYGNAAIDCPGVTREVVEREARRLQGSRSPHGGRS